MSKKWKEEDLGLVLAWLEDNPDTIQKVVKYLEERNFVINITGDIEEFQAWISENSIDSLLIDLVLQGQRDGVQVISELLGRGINTPIFPISAYIKGYRDDLKEVSDRFETDAIDKEMFDKARGLGKLRKLLLKRAGGGKIRVIERSIGYIEEMDKKNNKVVLRMKLPKGERACMELDMDVLSRLGSGKPEWGLEIKTVERKHAGGVKVQTFFRWVDGEIPIC